MPELPDVELFKRYLDRHALHRTVDHVAVGDRRILGSLPSAALKRGLEGASLERSRRHGKHLLVALGPNRGWLTLHFGMIGGLTWFDDPADDPPYDRLRLDFAKGGHLAYTNRRLLGRVGLTDDADRFIRDEKLGPDALDPAFDLAAFRGVVASRRRAIKAVLMDQAAMAGIGNIYADEILFQARLHPARHADSLGAAEVERLFEAAKEVLVTSIECGAGAKQFVDRLPEGYLLPHRRKGGRCPRCGGDLAIVKAAGRTGYCCPVCQAA